MIKPKIIIQARLGSTRLPNKVLKLVCGKPLLWHVWNRLSTCKNIDQIIIATTDLPEDDLIIKFCEENCISFYRGSADDVLARYYDTAKFYEAETIIRITADCPVIDPVIVDRMIELFRQEENLDYLGNTLKLTYPRGLDTEIFTFQTLERTYLEARQQYEREHVTAYMYRHPEIFNLKNYPCHTDQSKHRWTVDTEDDFKLIKEIYNSLYAIKELFLLEDILKLFDERPELININQHIVQKKLGE